MMEDYFVMFGKDARRTKETFTIYQPWTLLNRKEITAKTCSELES